MEELKGENSVSKAVVTKRIILFIFSKHKLFGVKFFCGKNEKSNKLIGPE
jgi:hypothetical protein